MKKGLVAFAFMLLFAGVVLAGSTRIQNAIAQLCQDAQTILGAAVMLLVVLAAVVYGIGQVMGAETRARASVWATSMIIGAVIALVIYLVVPMIIGQLVPGGSGGGATGFNCNFNIT